MFKDIGGYEVKYDELRICVVKVGVKNLTVFLLIWRKTEMKVNIEFSMKQKHIYRMHCGKQSFLKYMRKT